MPGPFDEPTDIVIPAEPPAQLPTHLGHASGSNASGIDFRPLVELAAALPRDEKHLLKRAAWIGSLMGERAYYSFPAGGQRITGPSIALAEALAGEWGGIAHEVNIVDAQPLASGGQRIHLRARAIDLKRVVIGVADAVTTTAPPPGKFARKSDQVERWHSMQIQSAASKIKRNALLDVLPAWFVDGAMRAALDHDAQQVLRGRSPQQAAEDTVQHFSGKGFSRSDLESIVGRPSALWTVNELQELRQVWRDIESGRATRESLMAEATTPAPVRGTLIPEPSTTPEPDLTGERTREPVPAEPASDDDGGLGF